MKTKTIIIQVVIILLLCGKGYSSDKTEINIMSGDWQGDGKRDELAVKTEDTYSNEEQKMSDFDTKNAISVKKIVKTDSHGIKIWWCKSTRWYTIDGWVGNPKNISLTEDTEIQGVNFPKGTTVVLDDNFRILEYSYNFLEPKLIQGIKVKQWTRFYPNGKIKKCIVSDIVEIQGIKYPQRSFIYFYEEGGIREIVLWENTEICGMKLPRDTIVEFNKHGEIQCCYIFMEGAEIMGMKLPKGVEVHFEKW